MPRNTMTSDAEDGSSSVVSNSSVSCPPAPDERLTVPVYRASKSSPSAACGALEGVEGGDTAADDAPVSVAEAECPSSEAGVPARSAQWAASGPQNSHARRATGATKVTASTELRQRGLVNARRADPPPNRNTHRHHARCVESQDNPRRCVTSRREAVHNCEGPAHVRQPMHKAPRSGSDAVPEQARDDQREHEVERDCAEAEPQRSVRRRERNDRVLPPNRSEAVEDDGRNMSDEEHHRQHRDIAMKKRRREARPTVAHPANTRHDPKEDTPGEQQQAHDAGAT